MKTSIYLILSLALINCNHTVDHTIDKKSLYYSKQSDSLLLNGNLKEAEVAIKKALELDDKNFAAYNNLGVLNFKLGRSQDEVLAPLLKSVSINGDYLVGLYSLAGYYHEIEQYSNSIKYCTKYIKIARNENDLRDSVAHMYAIRGECKNYLKQYNDALSDLNESIAINPNSAAAFKERGSAYRNMGRYDEAIENYSKAIAINPNYAQAYGALGICYDDGKKGFNKALENYSKAIELNPKSGTYFFNRGAFLFDNGFKGKAYQDLKKADSLGKTEAKTYLDRYN